MEELSNSIKNSFDVISLILVFAFVLFDIRYPQITHNLDVDIPPKIREIEREKYRTKLKQSLYWHIFPLILIYSILFYIQLPLFVRVISESNLQLWNFDFLRSAFFAIIVLIFIFLVWSVYLGIRLLYRISQSKP